ncbi:hypothetical protein [Dongia deserti]|uniref:hypothetical protein n=1 Tax=Dongia deserti TaxID=2268030 RepID=UPI000E6511A0|nr:hypothetical protein [Dongia deserti]
MLSDYQTLTDNLVRDDTTKITVADRDRALGLAFARYGKDRPRTKVEDLVGAGTNELALPVGWQEGFSDLKSLEHPVGNIPPTFIAPEFRRLYQKPASTVIQLDSAIGAGQAVRTTYTIRHQVDGVTDTIPVDDREPIASYAAAILLDELAAFFSGASDSTIQADAVDHRSRGDQFASRASRLRKFYFDQLGIDPKREVAAGTVVELDVRDSLGGPRMTHRLRR